MKNTQGVNEKAYTKDSEGRRFCPSPFLHYPDFCPHFPDDKTGDCLKHCADLPENERLCVKEATNKSTVVSAPAAPPGAKGVVDKEALDAVLAQVDDFGKTVQTELSKLAIAVGILRSRASSG